MRRTVVIGVVLAVALAGCGEGHDRSSQVPVPTVAQLQDALLVPADVTGDWAVDSEGTQGGMIELCADASAESKKAAADLRFQVGMKLREATGPGEAGAVYVVEYLLAEEDGAVEATFEALQAGALACYGKPLVPEEDYGTNEPYEVPAVGDDRYGEYHVMGSDLPGYGSYLHLVVVREGPVLMLLNVWEFLGSAGARPEVTPEDVGAIVTTAVGKLP